MREFITKFYLAQILQNLKAKTDSNFYWKMGLNTVKKLETDQGILASGKDELYGAIFGRDSLITSLELLDVYKETKNPDLLRIVKKVLLTLTDLQGREVNIESGEEPGKCIHEYRPSNHEHLTKDSPTPWYLYPDQVMRNYDSVDATPLLLITIYRYFQASADQEFLERIKENIASALDWIFKYADSNGDGFVDYGLNPKRRFGGLQNQNWMDSIEATFHEDNSVVVYPIAPVEAQAYTYLALKLWGNYFQTKNGKAASKLYSRARLLKQSFNQKFVIQDDSGTYLASAIDHEGKPLKSVRSSMGHCLWAALTEAEDGEQGCIIESKYIKAVTNRLFKEDLYEKNVGIRTLSNNSIAFSANSYHNGSIWPHDNSMIADGLENFGFNEAAAELRGAIMRAVAHFKTPIELFVYDENYLPYVSKTGQTACQTQAWSAAAILRALNAPAKDQKRIKLEIISVQVLKKNLVDSLLRKVNNVPRFELPSLLSLKDKAPFFDKRKS